MEKLTKKEQKEFNKLIEIIGEDIKTQIINHLLKFKIKAKSKK